MNTKEPRIISFKAAKEFETWLARNYKKQEGVWLRFFKKDSGVKTINRAEALDAALCYGWIDGQAKPFDKKSWLQKYTPRREKSLWSKRNKEHIARLTKLGKLKQAGQEQVELAQKDGRWEAAYDSPKNMKVPAYFLKELAKNKKAQKFFKTLSKTNLYAIAWRLQTAKNTETREKRMNSILDMLVKGDKFH